MTGAAAAAPADNRAGAIRDIIHKRKTVDEVAVQFNVNSQQVLAWCEVFVATGIAAVNFLSVIQGQGTKK